MSAAAQDAKALFDEGVDLWERGRADEAIAKFKEVLSLDPSSEDAYQMLDKVEYQLFLKMLAKGGDAELIAERFLDLARPARLEKRKDPAAIDELVEQAIHGADFGVRRKANLTLQAAHGEYAVPALLRYLGSNDIDERTHAVITLTHLGSDAVLPLIEALHADNVEVVRNACATLARIKDQRSIPALLAISEDESADELAAKMANEALASIEFDKGYEPANALDAHLHLAKMYYRGDPGVIVNFDSAWTLWAWKDGKLTSREVPRFLYGYELAEEVAYDALAIDPGNLDARIQLALVAFAEKASVNALGASAEGEELEALKAKLAGATGLAASQGNEVLDGAAMRAMSWGDTGVARVAMEAIAESWGDAPLTEECALVQGLSSDDKGIRYSAATAIVSLAPADEFPSMELVIPIMADAVAEGSNRQILVVEPDAETRTFLLHTLNGAGYYAVGADSGAAGLLRAKTYSVFDLVVLRSSLPDMTAFQVVKELKDDFRTRDIPVMMISSSDEDTKLYGSQAVGFIKDPMQPEVYLGDVKNAVSASLNDDRARALAVSLAACQSLAHYPGGILDPSLASAALADTLAEKPDDIRAAALHALARFGTPDVQAKVLDALTKTANATAIRVGAAKALGKCLHGQAPTAETFDALLAGMGEDDLALRVACGGALGKMDLTAEQRDQVLTARRIE
jgi:CheY-like chemotaxis protein